MLPEGVSCIIIFLQISPPEALKNTCGEAAPLSLDRKLCGHGTELPVVGRILR
jgi:hypothetical protein